MGWDRILIMMAFGAMMAVPGAETPAHGQCRLCAPAQSGSDSVLAAQDERGEPPLSVSITTDLDFSRIVSGGAGSVTIDPRGGGARATGAAVPMGGLAFTGRGHIEGAPGRSVRIDLPREVVLTSSSGGQARITDIVTNLAAVPRLGPDGRLDFAFGGRLELSGAVDGDYRGRVAIDVSYE